MNLQILANMLCFISDVCRDETLLRQMVHGMIKKKMRRRGSKGKGRVPRQYFERTSAVRLLIHSLETRCFRRVLQWVIARGSAILNLQVPLNLNTFIERNESLNIRIHLKYNI